MSYLDALILMLKLEFHMSFIWCFLPASERLTCLREAEMFIWVHAFALWHHSNNFSNNI